MFDCFPMYNELDLVELRLNTLSPVVEKFVIIESAHTHTGKPKELYFKNNLDRFVKFKDQIIYLEYKNVFFNDVWYQENNQRNTLLKALNFSKPKDNLLFVSDADEIPKPDKLVEAQTISINTGKPVSLVMADCLYYMNFVADFSMRGPFIYNPYTAEEFHKHWIVGGKPAPPDPSTIRWHVGSPYHKEDFSLVVEAGWHFSSLGGIEVLKKKIEACAHTQFDLPEIKSDKHLLKCMEEGVAYYDKVVKFNDMPVRKYNRAEVSFLPQYVQDNIDKYKKYII